MSKSLGGMLKEARVSHDLSMEQLAKTLNDRFDLKVTKSMISRWENDLSQPTNTFLASYAKLFNLDMNVLLGLEPIAEGYYTDPEVAEYAEQLRTNPEMKMLFSAAKDISKESMQKTYEYIKFLKMQEQGNDD